MLLNLSEIILLGLIGGAVPGPILTSAFTEVLRVGFRGSLKVIFQALIAETLVALVILFGIYTLDLPEKYFHIISLFGAAMLVWLAWQVWKINGIDSGNGKIFTFSKIFLLTILNGGFWIFWITICIPRAFLLAESIPNGQFLFIGLFEFGWLLATLGLAFIFSYFRPLLQQKNLVTGTFKVFSILLILFATKSLYKSMVFFLVRSI